MPCTTTVSSRCCPGALAPPPPARPLPPRELLQTRHLVTRLSLPFSSSSSRFARADLAGATAADEPTAQHLYLRTHFRRAEPGTLARTARLARESQVNGEFSRALFPAPLDGGQSGAVRCGGESVGGCWHAAAACSGAALRKEQRQAPHPPKSVTEPTREESRGHRDRRRRHVPTGAGASGSRHSDPPMASWSRPSGRCRGEARAGDQLPTPGRVPQECDARAGPSRSFGQLLARTRKARAECTCWPRGVFREL